MSKTGNSFGHKISRDALAFFRFFFVGAAGDKPEMEGNASSISAASSP